MSVRTVEPATEAGRDRCPECGGAVRVNSGEASCTDCGLVLDGVTLDRRPNYGDEWAAPRTAARHDRGLGGQRIGYTDANGRNVASPRLSRLRRQQRRAAIPTKAERNLVSAMVEIRRMASALNQPGAIAQACRLAETAQRAGLYRGRSIEGMASAALYAALRVNGQPFAPGDLAAVAKDGADVARCYAALNRELSLPAPPPTVAQYVPRVASAVGVSDDFEAAALELARRVDDAGPGGRSPSGLAAGCLYAVARKRGRNVTGLAADVFADAAGVTAPTVRAGADHAEALVE